MSAKMKRKIVCKYCGNHMDAGRKRCPFCGTYVDPNPVSAEDYTFDNIKDRIMGKAKKKDVSGAIYITEAHRGPGRKIAKFLVIFSIVCLVLGGICFGGYKVYQKLFEKEDSTSEITEPSIGTLNITVSGSIIQRSSPSVSSDSPGDAHNGDTFSVYEVVSAEGYTWYRVGTTTWIPDDGTWVEYIPEGGTVSE